VIPSAPDGSGPVATPPAGVGGMDDGPDGRRPGLRWPLVAGLAGAAASTLATAVAAAVAGRQADLALQPVELALRVGLLLAAPCVGAVLAAMVVPRGGGRLAVAAVGVGVPVGPLLVLRLDRLREFGLAPFLLVLGVLAAWGAVGAALAAGWWARPARRVQRTDLPAPDPAARPAGAPPEPASHLAHLAPTPAQPDPAPGPPPPDPVSRPAPGPPPADPSGAPRAAVPDPAGPAPARLRRLRPADGDDGDAAGPGDPAGPGAA
jgi:hypothetical protein